MDTEVPRIAVVGSRIFKVTHIITKKLDQLLNEIGPFTVVSGGADGPDKIAEEWAKARDLKTIIIPADWEKHGKKAGIKRNGIIVDNCDRLIAFWDGLSTGTLDSIIRAKKAKRLKDNVTVYLG